MPLKIGPHEQAQMESLLREGRKIEAIKLYREITGVGLKEAKDAIERYHEELVMLHPEQFGIPPEPTKSIGPTGCSGVLLAMLVVSQLVVLLVMYVVY
jgi:hypothetical protein